MNLHGVVSGCVSAVNPPDQAVLSVSTGYATADDGSRTSTYAAPLLVSAQVQAMSTGDIRKVDGLNLQGVQRAMYLSGEADGLVRINRKGGDVVTISAGRNAGVWLVSAVLEQWPDWCKVAVTLQNEVPS